MWTTQTWMTSLTNTGQGKVYSFTYEDGELNPPSLVMNMEILTPMGAVDSHIDTHKRPIHADTKNGSTSLHGSHDLPEGYRFAFVTPNAVFEIPEPIPGHTQVEHISSSRSVPKSLIAIFQAIYATITLYQTRGDQLERFGYAAFGLTVTPYLIMSVVNFAAQIATPDYQSLFLITSEVSDEAERRGGSFTGAVGRLHPAPDGGLSAGRGDIGVFENELPLSSSESPVRCRIMRRSQDSEWQIQALELSDEDFEPSRSCLYVPSCTATRSWTWTDSLKGWAGADDERLGGNKDGFSDPHALGVSAITSLLSIFVFDFVILLVIGLSTRFQARDSTYAQRAWILSWLVTGSLQGFFMVALPFAFRYEKKTGVLYWYITTVLTVVVLAYCTPAVGGLVTVAQELYQYGICN